MNMNLDGKFCFFFSSRRRHTRFDCDWSSDVCSSDLTIFDDPDAAKYVWGIGFHWYEDWSGGQQMYGNVALVNRLYPDKHILFTEGTPASFDSTGYGRWSLGEAYGRSMINDFNSGTEGWTDWNILLDERGGPNHVGSFCFARIRADTRPGNLIYTNSYY